MVQFFCLPKNKSGPSDQNSVLKSLQTHSILVVCGLMVFPVGRLIGAFDPDGHFDVQESATAAEPSDEM